jgi:hypothetical protein
MTGTSSTLYSPYALLYLSCLTLTSSLSEGRCESMNRAWHHVIMLDTVMQWLCVLQSPCAYIEALMRVTMSKTSLEVCLNRRPKV